MDDLVKLLRATYNKWNNPPSPELPYGANVVLQAADRIEALTADLAAAEAKLAQAERALDFADHMHRTVKGWQDYGNTTSSSIRSSMNAYENARAFLATIQPEGGTE